jgi:hypothetical protein
MILPALSAGLTSDSPPAMTLGRPPVSPRLADSWGPSANGCELVGVPKGVWESCTGYYDPNPFDLGANGGPVGSARQRNIRFSHLREGWAPLGFVSPLSPGQLRARSIENLPVRTV